MVRAEGIEPPSCLSAKPGYSQPPVHLDTRVSRAPNNSFARMFFYVGSCLADRFRIVSKHPDCYVALGAQSRPDLAGLMTVIQNKLTSPIAYRAFTSLFFRKTFPCCLPSPFCVMIFFSERSSV